MTNPTLSKGKAMADRGYGLISETKALIARMRDDIPPSVSRDICLVSLEKRLHVLMDRKYKTRLAAEPDNRTQIIDEFIAATDGDSGTAYIDGGSDIIETERGI